MLETLKNRLCPPSRSYAGQVMTMTTVQLLSPETCKTGQTTCVRWKKTKWLDQKKTRQRLRAKREPVSRVRDALLLLLFS